MPAALLINGNEPESNRTEARVDHAAVAIAQPAIIRTVDVTIGRRTSGHEAAPDEMVSRADAPSGFDGIMDANDAPRADCICALP